VALLPTLLSAMRSRRRLVIENLPLRQQFATLAGRRRPDIRTADRVFGVLLRRLWSRWAQALAIFRPVTVVRWHRAEFRIYWNGCPDEEGAPGAHIRHGRRDVSPAPSPPVRLLPGSPSSFARHSPSSRHRAF
jgi:hypothetical protein